MKENRADIEYPKNIQHLKHGWAARTHTKSLRETERRNGGGVGENRTLFPFKNGMTKIVKHCKKNPSMI